MTKYFKPKPVYWCLTCGRQVGDDYLEWPDQHKTHIFVNALMFGRKGEQEAYDGSTPFADTNDHLRSTPWKDVAGKTPNTESSEYIKYQEMLAKGIKPPTLEEEIKIIKEALGEK